MNLVFLEILFHIRKHIYLLRVYLRYANHLRCKIRRCLVLKRSESLSLWWQCVLVLANSIEIGLRYICCAIRRGILLYLVNPIYLVYNNLLLSYTSSLLLLASHLVLSSNVLSIESLVTVGAFEGLLFEMSPLVVFHISLGCKCFSANFANKGLLVSMNSNMNFKIRPFRKRFVAAVKGASEWLRTIVQVVVCLQSALS